MVDLESGGVDELLSWTEQLDFDLYYNNWLSMGESQRRHLLPMPLVVHRVHALLSPRPALCRFPCAQTAVATAATSSRSDRKFLALIDDDDDDGDYDEIMS